MPTLKNSPKFAMFVNNYLLHQLSAPLHDLKLHIHGNVFILILLGHSKTTCGSYALMPTPSFRTWVKWKLDKQLPSRLFKSLKTFSAWRDVLTLWSLIMAHNSPRVILRHFVSSMVSAILHLHHIISHQTVMLNILYRLSKTQLKGIVWKE